MKFVAKMFLYPIGVSLAGSFNIIGDVPRYIDDDSEVSVLKSL